MRCRGANFFSSTCCERRASSSSSRSAKRGTFLRDVGSQAINHLEQCGTKSWTPKEDSIKGREMTTRCDNNSGWARSDRLAQFQHAEVPVAGERGGEMFECVAADDVA